MGLIQYGLGIGPGAAIEENQSKVAMQRPANFYLYDVVSNEYQRNVVQNIMEVTVCVKINLGAAFIPTSQNTCHLF